MRYIVSLLLAACAAPPEPQAADLQVVVPTLRGNYFAYITLSETRGTCEFVKNGPLGNIDFDTDGNAVSPLPGTINCTTRYPLVLFCQALGNKITYTGTHSNVNGDHVTSQMGTFDAAGNVGGCLFARGVLLLNYRSSK